MPEKEKKRVIRRKKVLKKKKDNRGNPAFLDPDYKGGPGRPVGSPNKIPTKIKLDFLKAFSLLGGAEALAEWACKNKENLNQFYKWMYELVPKEMEFELVEAQKSIEDKSNMGSGTNITIISQMPRLPEPLGGDIMPIDVLVTDTIPIRVNTEPIQEPIKLLPGEELAEDGSL